MKRAGKSQDVETANEQKPEDLLKLYGQNFDALLENISAGESPEGE